MTEYRETHGQRTEEDALGTPGYMPPEALLAETGSMDERSDVYSLGAILYRILTGRLPADPVTPIAFRARFVSWTSLVRRCRCRPVSCSLAGS